MTINDATPYPMEDPEQLGQAFGEVFDLVDETVEGVTDAEVEQRLRQLLADTATPVEAIDLSNLDRVLRGPNWNVPQHLDPTTLAGMTGQAAWDEAHCALQVAREQLVVARAAVDAARREAEEQRAAAAAAQRQAEEAAAGVNAYVDAALDRAKNVLADAQAEAARLVAKAEQQAEEILAGARARTNQAEMTPIASPKARYLLVTGSAGSGKTALFAAELNALRNEPNNDASCEPLVPAKPGVPPPYTQWHRLLTAIEPLLPAPAMNLTGFSGLSTWSELAQHVTRVLNDHARFTPQLTGSAAGVYRIAAGDLPEGHLRETLCAITSEVPPPQHAASNRRAVRVYYPNHTDKLANDLCVVLDRPDTPLANDGRREDGGQCERWWAMVAPPASCPDLVGEVAPGSLLVINGELGTVIDVSGGGDGEGRPSESPEVTAQHRSNA